MANTSNTNSADNTVPWIDTNLSEYPYFDDTDETKDYERVLFKPTVGLQTRELNALQTYIQKQNARVTSSIFQDGTRIKGGSFNIDLNANYVRLQDNDQFGHAVNVTNFANTVITGATSGVKAHVSLVQAGTQAASPNTNLLIVKYTAASSSNNSVTTFTPGEIISSDTGFTATVINLTSALGSASTMKVDDGIFFCKGFPVRFSKSSIILDPASSTPSCRVGIIVNENIVNYEEDPTLLSNAAGFNNYNAPGADRLQLLPELTILGLTESVPSNFSQICVLSNGVIQSVNQPDTLSNVMDVLAQRQYETTGNFVANGMNLSVVECLDSGINNGYLSANNGGNTYQLAVGVQPGYAFVKGYNVQYYVTQWDLIDKGIDYVNVDSVTIQTNYGNYANVKQLAGYFDTVNGTPVSLYSANQYALSNNTYVSGSYNGSIIGTARVREVELQTGNYDDAAATFNVYLYDVKMTANDFSAVCSIVSNTGVCDIIPDASSNTAYLYDASFDDAVFPIANQAIRTIRNANGNVVNSYEFTQSFPVTIASSGTFTVATGSSSETFPYSPGLLNSTQVQDFMVVLQGSANVALQGTVTTVNGNTTVTGANTIFSTQLRESDKINVGGNLYRVANVNSNTSLTLWHPATSNATSSFSKQYISGDIVPFNVNGTSGTARTITASSSTSAAFNLEETLSNNVSAVVFCKLIKANATEKKKHLNNAYVIIDTTTHSANTVGPYSLGFADIYSVISCRTSANAFVNVTDGTDVSSYFLFNTGQNDDLYGLGSMSIANTSVVLDRYLLVNVAFFSHDFSQGSCFFTVDSYPVDDTTYTSNSTIRTELIPYFQSPSDGTLYSLRQCIDFRPALVNTAANSATISGATTNPSANSTLNVPSGGLHFPVIDSNFTSSFSYYQGRVDLVTLTPTGGLNVIRGAPADSPVTPQTPSSTMALGTVQVPPYPSLANTVTTSWLGSKGYTMQMIGALETRIAALEYYSSLNLLEQSTSALQILDSNGLNRFKNGFIADNFSGSNIVNVYDVEYLCSIDTTNQLCRPRFYLNQVKLDYDQVHSNNCVTSANAVSLILASNNTTFVAGQAFQTNSASGTVVATHGNRVYLENIIGTFAANSYTLETNSSPTTYQITSVVPSVNGSLLTLPWTNYLAIQQPYATETRNAAGLEWDWVGNVTLYPPSDYWVDTNQSADVVLNVGDQNDNWEANNGWVTTWNSWQTVWTGTSTSNTTTTQITVNSASDLTDITAVAQYVINGGTLTLGRLGGNYGLSTIESRWSSFFSDNEPLQGVIAWLQEELSRYGSSGVETVTIQNGVSTTNTVQTRTGTSSLTTYSEQTSTVGDYVIDTSLNPYMRSQAIVFVATGMKPNAQLYPFFDNIAVSQYCAPLANVSFQNSLISVANTNAYIPLQSSLDQALATGIEVPTLGDPLISDANGNVIGVFYLPDNPNRQFNVGSVVFRLSDSLVNSNTVGDVTTSAEATYSAYGITDTTSNLIVSTQVASTQTQSVTQTQTLSSTTTTSQVVAAALYEPIVQSFSVPLPSSETAEGVFVTRLDLFFQTADPVQPVTISLVALDPSTAQVTSTTIPLSTKILYPGDINVSADGTVPTPFYFDSPIYLTAGQMYGFKIFPGGSNPNYNVWVATLGQTDVSTGIQVIQNPASGNLFVSSNDQTYTAVTNQQVKFNLYVAQFNTSVQGSAVLYNDPQEYLQLSSNTGGAYFMTGEPIFGPTTITLSNVANGTPVVGDIVRGSTSNTSGYITAVSNNVLTVTPWANQLGASYFSNDAMTILYANGSATGITSNTISVTFPSGLQSSSSLGTLVLNTMSNTQFQVNNTIVGQFAGLSSVLNSFGNIQYDVYQPTISSLVFPKTSIAWAAKTTSNTGTLDSSYNACVVNNNNNCLGQRVIYTNTYEKNMLGDHSFKLNGILSTSDAYLSPVIDLTRSGVILVGNIINNVTTNETTPHAGQAAAKYVTRLATLDANMDAEDIVVYVTAYRPPGTDLPVYVKLSNFQDTLATNDHNWVQLVPDGTAYSDATDPTDYIEYTYNLPSSVMTGPDGGYQYVGPNNVTFSSFRNYIIKIVMISDDSSNVPLLSNMRAVCLQM
jgi:hypothetical protein